MGERSAHAPALDLPLELERGRGEALHRQIEAALREAIERGRLADGTALPPSRALAEDLGVSRGVVVEAYSQLAAEGYLSSRSGSYTTVARPAAAPAEPAPDPPRAPYRVDFCPCRADGSLFPARPGCDRCATRSSGSPLPTSATWTGAACRRCTGR